MKEIRIKVIDGHLKKLREEIKDYKEALQKIRNTDPLNFDLTEKEIDDLLELNEILNKKARMIAAYLGIEDIEI